MKIDAMRSIDRWAGIPLTFLLTLLRRPFGREGTPAAAKRVLFIELSEMGSTILADPAMRKTQTALGAEIFFVIFKRNAASLDILNTVPRANIRTIREDSLFALAIDTLSFLIWTRRKKIDTVVDLELFSRFTALLTGLSGAANRVGFYRFHNEGLYRGELLTHRVAYNPHIHIAKNFIALVNALASARTEVPYSKTVVGDEELSLPRLVAGGREIQAIEARIAGVFPSFEAGRHRVVLFNPNASDLLPQRRWPVEHFALLARRILERWEDALILVTGAPEEAGGAEELRRRVDHARIVNFAGQSTLAELPQLYSAATLMVSNDSGPPHFAAVTDMPTIVLFGPETPSLYAPLGRTIALTAGLACSPCVSAANHRKTACMDPVCMAAILPERVLDEVAKVLDGAGEEG
jgi:ADP-heptose:LPS heptosyltransferase